MTGRHAAAELWRRQHEAEDALVHGDVGPSGDGPERP
jgi:hypothetical protein